MSSISSPRLNATALGLLTNQLSSFRSMDPVRTHNFESEIGLVYGNVSLSDPPCSKNISEAVFYFEA